MIVTTLFLLFNLGFAQTSTIISTTSNVTIVNTATVSANSSSGTVISANSSTTTKFDVNASLSVTKSISSPPSSPIGNGSVIGYQILFQNIGVSSILNVVPADPFCTTPLTCVYDTNNNGIYNSSTDNIVATSPFILNASSYRNVFCFCNKTLTQTDIDG